MKSLMRIISAAFHPLLIATYLSILIVLKAPEVLPRIQPAARMTFVGLVFLITFLMPAFSILLLKTFKYISSLDLINKKERIVPFAFITFYYGVGAYLFAVKLELSFLFNTVMISVTLLIFLLLLITTKFKISIHAAAIWSGVGYITGLQILYGINTDIWYYLIIFIAGLTSSSRLYLGFHSPEEIWTGIILGWSYGVGVLLLV